jgi:hypothetical protein
MSGSRRALVFGLLTLGLIGMGGSAAASASPFGQDQIGPTAAAQSLPHLQTWKAECWWIDDHRIGAKRWGTAKGTGGTRVQAVQDAQGDVPNGAVVHHCDTNQ